jgi:hypothetical protein
LAGSPRPTAPPVKQTREMTWSATMQQQTAEYIDKQAHNQ